MVKKISSFVFVFLLMASSAQASYICSGAVSGVAVNPFNGQLMAERVAGISWPILCNLNGVDRNITPESCKAMMTLLLSAQMSGKTVTLWFNDEDEGGSCSSHQGWQPLTGWYFGPKIDE